MAQKGGIQHAKKVFPRERRLLRVKTEKVCHIPTNRAKSPPAKNEKKCKRDIQRYIMSEPLAIRITMIYLGQIILTGVSHNLGKA